MAEKKNLDSDIKSLIETLHSDRFKAWGEMLKGGSGSDAACEMEGAIAEFIKSVGNEYDLSDLELPEDED
jgi:hypothetical protein